MSSDKNRLFLKTSSPGEGRVGVWFKAVGGWGPPPAVFYCWGGGLVRVCVCFIRSSGNTLGVSTHPPRSTNHLASPFPKRACQKGVTSIPRLLRCGSGPTQTSVHQRRQCSVGARSPVVGCSEACGLNTRILEPRARLCRVEGQAQSRPLPTKLAPLGGSLTAPLPAGSLGMWGWPGSAFQVCAVRLIERPAVNALCWPPRACGARHKPRSRPQRGWAAPHPARGG